MARAATAETASVQVGDTRLFKYGLIAPAVFLMVLVAVLPLVYLIVVSFQRISLSDEITSFEGFVNYARIFSDARLWNAVLHTLFITAVALPIELVLGLLLAYHFLEERRFKRLFVALQPAHSFALPF